MIVTYEITEEVYTFGGCSRTSYGIAAYAVPESDDITEAPAIVASVRDISSDKTKLAELVRECNRLELSPIHLCDAVEDFLAD